MTSVREGDFVAEPTKKSPHQGVAPARSRLATEWPEKQNTPGPKTGGGMWRWGELNPRPMQLCQGFSGRSVLRDFSAPAIMHTSG